MTVKWRRAYLIAAIALVAGCGSEDSSVGPDRQPPSLLALHPMDGASAVPLESAIQATFSEPVVVDSLRPPLRVNGPSGPIPGTSSLDSTGTVLSFVPEGGLSPATDYHVVLAAGIADLAGNVRPDSLATQFTTALNFLAIGRIFVTSLNSRDVRAFDVRTYAPVPGSPVALGLRPIRLRAIPETGEVYVLYFVPPDRAGVLVIDGATLAVLRDSGDILTPDVSDVDVSATDDRAFITATEANQVVVLEASSLTPIGDPIRVGAAGSDPVRVTVARRRRLLVVGLEGAGRIAAFELPSLRQAAGFPVAGVRQMHSIVIDETRARAWVGGGLRYAVVDLVNPARTISFQIPNLPNCLAPQCTPRAWSLILSPPYDRAYILDRRQWISSARVADLSVVDENWGSVSGVLSDLIQNPRSGELVVVDARSVGANLIRVDPAALSEIGSRIQNAGDGPINMGVLP